MQNLKRELKRCQEAVVLERNRKVEEKEKLERAKTQIRHRQDRKGGEGADVCELMGISERFLDWLRGRADRRKKRLRRLGGVTKWKPQLAKVEEEPGVDHVGPSTLRDLRRAVAEAQQEAWQRRRKDSVKKVDLISFCKAGERRKKTKRALKNEGALYRGVCDWACRFDLTESAEDDGESYIFPSVVCATNHKPDGYIISRAAKCVLVVELTVPAEENVRKWNKEKRDKYKWIKDHASSGWTVIYVGLEVGMRGWVPRSFMDGLRKLGMQWQQVKKLSNAVVDMARKASYVIFINRANKKFNPW